MKTHLPNFLEARRRSKQRINIDRSEFKIPDDIKNIGNERKYYLRTYGCQSNERDGETIAGILEMMGFVRTTIIEEADFVLLNTCAVRANAENKVLGELGSLKRLKTTNPDLILGMCGCMAQEESVINTILKQYDHVDLVFGTHNIHRLPQLLYHTMLSKEKTIEVFSKEGEIIENLPVKRFGEHKAFVNIMYGCDKFCTYCIVPYTRGKERSRLIEDVLQEIQQLKDEGFKEVMLLGQNVNAYGKDLGLGYDFAFLLEEVAKVGIPRIRFMTSHPWDFTDKMVEVIAHHENIMPFIHLPLQSGNDDILKKMGRRYTVESYLKIFDKLKQHVKNIAFSTDIIVGFPNETQQQFEDTLKVIKYCEYDNCFTFIYSPRENTPAAKLVDNVTLEEKNSRFQILSQLCNEIALEKNKQCIGKVLHVLVDGPSKKNKQVFAGYAENGKLVNFVGDNISVGEIVEVKITAAKTWSLYGEAIK